MDGSVSSKTRAFFFNPKSSAFNKNPYKIYKVMRESHPSYYLGNTLILTRYSDISQCLNEPSLVTSGIINKLIHEFDKKNIELCELNRSMLRDLILFQEGDVFAKHRKSLMAPLTGIWIEEFRYLINLEVDLLVSKIQDLNDYSEVNIIEMLIKPLWVNLFSAWLGFSQNDKEALHAEVKNMRLLLDPSSITLDGLQDLKKALINLDTLFQRNYKDNKEGSSKGIFYKALHHNNDEYTARDYTLDAIACFIGGTETIVAVIVNTLLLLAEWPEEQRNLRSNPKLLRNTLAESMRMETPAQMTRRTASADVHVGNTIIKKGDDVVLCLASGNRDEQMFVEPDQFDITRKNSSKHLAFTAGRYQCVGRALGQYMTEIVCEKMLSGFNSIKLAANHDVIWQRESLIMRMPSNLVLDLT